MKVAYGKICPFCAELIPTTGIHSCENDLKSDYSIVPDGAGFGIVFRGEIKVQGLSLESAKRILTLLNSNQKNKDRDYD